MSLPVTTAIPIQPCPCGHPEQSCYPWDHGRADCVKYYVACHGCDNCTPMKPSPTDAVENWNEFYGTDGETGDVMYDVDVESRTVTMPAEHWSRIASEASRDDVSIDDAIADAVLHWCNMGDQCR